MGGSNDIFVQANAIGVTQTQAQATAALDFGIGTTSFIVGAKAGVSCTRADSSSIGAPPHPLRSNKPPAEPFCKMWKIRVPWTRAAICTRSAAAIAGAASGNSRRSRWRRSTGRRRCTSLP